MFANICVSVHAAKEGGKQGAKMEGEIEMQELCIREALKTVHPQYF